MPFDNYSQRTLDLAEKNMEFVIKTVFVVFILSNPLTGYAVEIQTSSAAETSSGVTPNFITSTQFGLSGGPAPINSKYDSIANPDPLERSAVENKATTAAVTFSGIIPNFITSTQFGTSGGGSKPSPINSNKDVISVSDSVNHDGSSFVANPAGGIGVSFMPASKGSAVKTHYNNRGEEGFAIGGESSIKRIGPLVATGGNIGKKLQDSINLGLDGILSLGKSLFGTVANSGEKIARNKNAYTSKPGSIPVDISSLKGIGDKIANLGGVSANGVINGAVAPGNSFVAPQDNYGKAGLNVGGELSLPGMSGAAVPEMRVPAINYGNSGGTGASIGGGIPSSIGIGDTATPIRNVGISQYGNAAPAPGGLLSLVRGIGDAATLGANVVGTPNNNAVNAVLSLGGVPSFPGILGDTAPERSVSAINYGNSGDTGVILAATPSFKGIADIAAPRGNVENTQYGNALESLLALLGGINMAATLGANILGRQNDNSGETGPNLGDISSFRGVSGAVAPERSVLPINSGAAGFAIGGIPSLGGIGNIAGSIRNVAKTQHGNVGSALGGLLPLVGGIGRSATAPKIQDSTIGAGVGLGVYSPFGGIGGAIESGGNIAGSQHDNSGKPGAALARGSSFGGAISSDRNDVVAQQGITGASAASDRNDVVVQQGITGASAASDRNDVVVQQGNTGASAASEGTPVGIQQGLGIGIGIGGGGVSQERVPSIGGNFGESQYNSADAALGRTLLAGAGASFPMLYQG